MLLCNIVALAFLSTVFAQAPYIVAINQSLTEAALLTADSVARWSATASLFVDVNTAMQYSIGNMSAIYNQPNASLFVNATMTNGNCPVPSTTTLITNQTIPLEFLCCHVQKIRSPGLIMAMTRMSAVYLSASTNVIDPTSILLLFIQQIIDIYTIGFVGRACLDDVTVINPQMAIAGSVAVTPVAGILLQTYADILLNTQSIFTCVNATSTYCIVNGTVGYDEVPFPYIDFPDSAYESVCGYDKLSQFETARFATPCQPP